MATTSSGKFRIYKSTRPQAGCFLYPKDLTELAPPQRRESIEIRFFCGVLIVQNDTGNRHSPTVIAAAITSQMGKAKLPTHIGLLDAQKRLHVVFRPT